MPKVKTAKTDDGSYKYKSTCFMFNGKKYRCRGKTQKEADEKAAAKLYELQHTYFSASSLHMALFKRRRCGAQLPRSGGVAD